MLAIVALSVACSSRTKSSAESDDPATDAAGAEGDAGAETDVDADADDASDAADTFGSEGDGGDCGSFLGCSDMVCGPGIPSPSAFAVGGDLELPSASPRCSDMCDIYAQDCQTFEKCSAIPYWSDRPALNGNYCVPHGDGAPGDACTAAEGPLGTETCGVTSVCMGLEADRSGQGTCVELCGPPEDAPTCTTPGTRCARLNEGVLPVCATPCDPLALEPCSSASTACLAYIDLGWTFPGSTNCLPVPDAPIASDLGDPCYGVSECTEGQACVFSASAEDECGGWGCCRLVCDTDATAPCGATGQCQPLGESAFPKLGYCEPG